MRRTKLIRDFLPGHPEIRETTIDAMRGYDKARMLDDLVLVGKMHEEVVEIAQQPHDVAEYADLLSVLYTLAAKYDISPAEIERERERKVAERGGFSKRRLIVEDLRSPGTARPTLDDLIAWARHYKMSDEEIAEQRASWVRGEMAMGSDADEARERARILGEKA